MPIVRTFLPRGLAKSEILISVAKSLEFLQKENRIQMDYKKERHQ